MTHHLLLLLLLGALPPQAPAGFPRIGGDAPAFAFSGVVQPEGSPPLRVSDLTPERLRDKVVVLDFFATWCAPCIEAIPHTNELIEASKDLPLVYLAVANQERSVLEAFLERQVFRPIIALDDGETTHTNYFVTRLPFVVIIDTEGKISAFSHPARVTKAMLQAAVRQPAGASPAPPALTPRSAASLTTLALRVHHEDAMVAFYTEAFGMRFRVVETSGLRSRFGELGGLTLKFVPIRDAADFDGFPVHQPGFEVPDLARVVAIAQRHGGRVQDPPVTRDGRLHASIRDPDGNTIEIYGPRPADPDKPPSR